MKLHHNGLFYLLTAASIVLVSAVRIVAQDSAMNERGFQPGNSYALSNIESINTVNGNVGLRFPLASLPVGRGGLTASINLLYNSKLYDSEIAYFLDENEPCEMQGGDPPEGVLVCNYYQKRLLKPSEDGGWRYGMSYSLKLIDRHDQLANVPHDKRPQCFFGGLYGGVTPGYYELRYRYKLLLVFPDGSSHEMRPNGWTDGNFNDPLGDYFDIRPDGLWDTCQSGPTWYPNTITYYSTDGTFLRLDVQHDSDDYWWNNPWTLYLPDGTRVTGGNTPQRIYDRNDNYVQINFVANYNGSGYGATQIVDQLNRSITLTSDGAEDLVISQGFGGTYTWKVRSKTIRVQKSYWPCEEQLSCPWQVQQQELFGMPFWVVDRITLPSQVGALTYTFSYNAPFYTVGDPYVNSTGWGELSGITLPTGAHADYSYAQNGSQPYSATPDILRNSPTSKVLTYNQEYDGTSTPVTETWTYAIERTGSIITGPDGGTTSQSFVDTQATFRNSGQILATVNADGSKTETIWAWNELASSLHANPYPKTVFTSIKNAGGSYARTAIKDYKYDKNGNVTRVAEYDWVDYASVPRDSQGMPTGIPSIAPTRVTANTYFNATPDATQLPGSNSNVYWSSSSPRVKNAIATAEARKIVSGGAESPVTRVEYSYDNASTSANLTQVRTWDSTKGGYTQPLTSGNSLTATTQYNQYGMPTLVTDARGLKTLMTYGQIGSVSDLYPTQIKTSYQTSQERTETREYDFGTGLVTRVTDVDNNVSAFSSFDIFGRPTLVRAAEGKAEETETTYEYSDALRRVITRTEFSATDNLVSIEHFDQLGRTRLSRRLETAGQSATNEEHGIKVQTRYRFSGANSFQIVSNSYRATTSSAASAEPTMGWTRNKNDIGGRTIEVQTFGGATLPAPWGSNTTSTGTVTTAYDANFTTVTDQAQKQRRSVSDALGRLVRVDEPDPNGNLGPTTSPTQPTHYSYDVLGNLTKVTQSDGTTTQVRDFVYSSLSRLTSATNPESGQIGYQYDESGNLLVKTDARGVSSHYAYDALNRITRRWYNGSSLLSATTHNSPILPSGVGATNEAKFYYDAQSLPSGAPSYSRGTSMGRLVAQTYGTGSNGDYFGYDSLGRATLKIQQLGAINYQMSAAYNLGSAITSITYPSGRTVNNTYDQAGRLNGFGGNLGDGVIRTYATSHLYSPFGGLVNEQFGTNALVYHKVHYNNRGQLCDVRASNVNDEWGGELGALVNYYSTNWSHCGNGPDNNGNVLMSQTIINSYYMEDRYSYDHLNRLNAVNEYQNGATHTGSQQYTYDRWGNRKIKPASWGTGFNTKQFDVDPNTNRLIVPVGQPGVMSYDAAGNLTNDTYTGAGNRTYDAENKITSAWGGNNQAQLYAHDANGQRIKRTVDGVETWQVYGFGGELFAEYAANSAAATPQKEYGYRNGQLLVTVSAGSGLVGHWKTDENTGTATADSTGNGNSGTLTSGAGWTTGQSGSAVNLDGVNDYVQVGAQSSLVMASTASFSAWVHPTGPGSDATHGGTILVKEGEYVIARYPNGTIRWGFANSNPGWAFVDTGYVAPLNQWTHVAITYDNGTIKTYANGSLVHTYSGSGSIGDAITGQNDFRIGGRQVITQHFQGRVDEVRVYNRALSATEVSALASGPASAVLAVNWLVADHLGTPRMIIDQTGTLTNIKRHDYLPFGEELYAGSGGRSAAMGYSGGDGVRQQFTHKERDVETGLDYFGARHYANAQGRFTSPDPLHSSGRPIYPQSWNRYSYVINQPLLLTDPNGLDWGVATWYDEENQTWITHYRYFTGEIGEYNKRTYTAVNFGDDATRTLDLSDGRTVTISNDPDVLGGAYMRDVTSRPQAEQAPVLPPSWVDYVPVVSNARRFLFNYTTHNFEGALLDFSIASAELGTASVASSAAAARSFATAPGEAIFYSGRGSFQLATQAAKAEGGKLISDTVGGQVLNVLTKPLPDKASDLVWKWGSRHFAEGASGNVRAFLREPLRNNSTWRQVEYPILRVNPFVRITTP